MTNGGGDGAPAAGGFVCVCVQKGVEFDIVDHKLHRANKDRELHEELEKLTDLSPSEYGYQLGGGCRVVKQPEVAATGSAGNHPVYLASFGESVAAFEGTLQNLQQLDAAFPEEGQAAHAAISVGVGSDSRDVTPPAASGARSPAHIICVMYARIGIELLKYLRGKFSFCMYHGKTGRVLAARDSSGEVPLFQGMSNAESLVIASAQPFMDTCKDVVEFKPGHFKYGWYAEPREFSPDTLTNHHYGHTNTHTQHAHHGHGQGSRRTSIDQHRSSLDPHTGRQALRSDAQSRSGPRRASMDAGVRRTGKDKEAQCSSEDAASNGEEGDWTKVSGGKHRGNNRPPRERRHSHSVLAGQKAHTPASQRAVGSASKGTPGSSGFKFDVNAPAFTPSACHA